MSSSRKPDPDAETRDAVLRRMLTTPKAKPADEKGDKPKPAAPVNAPKKPRKVTASSAA